MKNNSTPSEGWDRAGFYQLFHGEVIGWGDDGKPITVNDRGILDEIEVFIEQEIAKARQEVMMTELVHCEEAIERARHQERKEFIETLFDNIVFSKDQARRIKELEEEK